MQLRKNTKRIPADATLDILSAHVIYWHVDTHMPKPRVTGLKYVAS